MMLPLLVVLIAFGLRIMQIETVIHDHDHGVPHGAGIGIVEAIQDARWSDLPALSFPTGVRVRNPAAASYLWAVIALFDRSPWSASVVSVLLNLLGVAALYSLARRVGGRRAGLVAAFLMATSAWSADNSRRAWMIGQMETYCTVAAWLIWPAVTERRPRRLLAGLLAVAVFMQTYLTAYGLAAQAGLASIWTLATAASRRLRIAAGVGIAACLVGAVVFATLIVTQPDSGLTLVGPATTRERQSPQSIPNPFGLFLDRAPAERAFGLVSGSEFDPGSLLDGLSAVPAALIVVGSVVCLSHVRKDVLSRIILIWFAVPIVVAIAVGIAYPRLGFGARQYQMLTIPAGYVLAGLGAMQLLRVFEPKHWRLGVSASVIAAMSWLGVTGSSMLAMRMRDAARVFDPMVVGEFALSYQPAFAQAWWASCGRSDNPQLPEWQASILGSLRPVAQARAQFAGRSEAWQFAPAGIDCVTISDESLAPPNAELVDRRPVHGHDLITYRALPVPDTEALLSRIDASPVTPPLPLNLGWTLLGQRLPTSASRGGGVSLLQAWRIDSVPAEKHDKWYYTLFVRLTDASGAIFDLARSTEDGPLPPGRHWVTGDYIISRQWLEIPTAAAPGPARLDVSIFDARQGVNAAYLDPLSPGGVTVSRALTLTLR